MDEEIVANDESSAAITCEVDGYPQPSVLFQKSSIRIYEGKRIKLLGPINIPVNIGNITRNRYVLNITKVLRVDQGEYECYAKNDVGESIESAFLDVQCK